ncbi:MAG TPA: lactate racemase domain-containing protein [Clostridia bacterium]|nr:lactate racemase domain-containing protein [Clostridia bacterium]
MKSETGIDKKALEKALKESLAGKDLKKVLLIPPDYTRMYSGAGTITAIYYDLLKDSCEVDILPALGTHEAMTKAECLAFFGEGVPFEKIIVHNWKTDVTKLGEVPAEFVKEVSEGLVDSKIDVEVNRLIMDKSYDLIISIGQVVPHEVVGMANYSKNIFVGCGGSSMINSSHMLGAFYGMERLMGKDFSPVRLVFDYAQEKFIADVPLMYVLTVTTNQGDDTFIHGLYIGNQRQLFEQAVAMSQAKNLTCVGPPLKKVVVFLDEREFKSMWLGNKAIYRTRMAMAQDGELIILAPGVNKFGEDKENDRLIRKYGYVGRLKVLELVKENEDLQENLSVAAHLIHGSSDGRFNITYCTEKLTEQEVTDASFDYMPYCKATQLYNPKKLKDGFNQLENGEEIFYISNPALGLWTCKTLE